MEKEGLFLFNEVPSKIDVKKRVESKIYSKLNKYRKKYKVKIDDDIEQIKCWCSKINEGEQVNIISNVIDSPNIVNAYLDKIEEIFIATWSITPAGVGCLEELSNKPQLRQAAMLIDKTHSYKWIFTSGAYKVFGKKIQVLCAANHTKFIVMKLSDGTYLNFLGSMNLSNNPRYENLIITKDAEDFEFIKSFIMNVESQKLKYGEESNSGSDKKSKRYTSTL